MNYSVRGVKVDDVGRLWPCLLANSEENHAHNYQLGGHADCFHSHLSMGGDMTAMNMLARMTKAALPVGKAAIETTTKPLVPSPTQVEAKDTYDESFENMWHAAKMPAAPENPKPRTFMEWVYAVVDSQRQRFMRNDGDK